MKRYFLFDNIIQSEKAPSLAIAAHELMKFLELDLPVLKEARADLGSEVLALNKQKFILRNAHTLSLAAQGQGSIVCVENSAFNSLQMTKEALSKDSALQEKTAKKLLEFGIVLNFETEVLNLETFLVNVVGIEKLASLVQHPFNNFHVAHFLGTSFCQTRNFTDTTLMGKLLSMLQAKKVNFASVYESNGFEVFECSELLAKQLASTAMLDMFDNAADFVLIDDARSFIMFDFYQKALEKVASRDINLCVLSLAQILLLSFGVTQKEKLGLDKHKIPATLV